MPLKFLTKNIERATALLIGPGFGTEYTTKEFIENILSGKSVPKKSTVAYWLSA